MHRVNVFSITLYIFSVLSVAYANDSLAERARPIKKGCKIKFNGIIKSESTKDFVNYYLSCPAGSKFEFDAAPVYKCNLLNGDINPTPIPQCVLKPTSTLLDCGDLIALACAPPEGQKICGGFDKHQETGECEEGCYCPEGTVFHEGKCITEDQCPCTRGDKTYKPGESYQEKCDNCVCQNGRFNCQPLDKSNCGVTCIASGDPHFTTFDGKKYDYMGQCTFYLLKTRDLSVELETAPYAGGTTALEISDATANLPSVANAIIIKKFGIEIKVKQKKEILVNGRVIDKLPYTILGITIRYGTSEDIYIDIPGGVQVVWSGIWDIYVTVPFSYKYKTRGLCGTFSKTQDDDFMLPNGTIVQSALEFGNSWKSVKSCRFIPTKEVDHPCTINPDRKAAAEKFCLKLKSNIFKECHKYVDPDPHYENCVYDGCACQNEDKSTCLCPTLSVYASECTRRNVLVDWKKSVPECGVPCPEGQTNQLCGNSCYRTCEDLSLSNNCKPSCVEGCSCPEGKLLDNGKCVRISECKCLKDGTEYPPGFIDMEEGSEICVCANGKWNCKPTVIEPTTEPGIDEVCKSNSNSVFTNCKPFVPLTCQNMHLPEQATPANLCKSGCKCKAGFVLNDDNKCIPKEECPCILGGKSYGEGYVVKKGCKTCTCKNEEWSCNERECLAECSLWGNSHYKTFDGKQFDYQGKCVYMLATASSGNKFFEIINENDNYGKVGTTSLVSFTIRLGIGSKHESLKVNRDKPLLNTETLEHILVRDIGLFVIIEVPELSLTIHWDKGSRLYIKLDNQWKNKIKGLCGNFNGNEGDDFTSPSGQKVSLETFVTSWKLKPNCPKTSNLDDVCRGKPDLLNVAQEKCSILHSYVFSPCHESVPMDQYYKKCLFDICHCEQDCDCLCIALSAYAEECNLKEVPLRWRTQQICPLQCEENYYYEPCLSACPIESCDYLQLNNEPETLCERDSCQEGCTIKPCPPNEIYGNSSHLECVPREACAFRRK